MALKRNIIANFMGQGVTALMGLAFLPVYVRHLGAEAYGLVGIFVLMQAWLGLLDFGMSSTLSREVARLTDRLATAQPLRDLLRTLEILCCAAGVLVAAITTLTADWIAHHWISSVQLSPSTVSMTISVMGAVLALRLLEGLYRGAVIGMQSQVWLSAVTAGAATLRWGGAAWLVTSFDADIVDFFVWQGLVSLLSVGALSAKVHRRISVGPGTARFSTESLHTVKRFAAGMVAATFLSIVLTQADKIILSKVLSLESFGHYAFAGTVAAGLYQLTAPLTQAYYPRLTELVARGDMGGVANTYHQGAQLVSAVTIPAALVLLFFADPLITLWSGDSALSRHVAPILGLLAIGTMLNALMHIPHALSLAYGWPGFLARLNLIAVCVLVPAILAVTPRYGAVGAAWIWVFLNAGYVALGVQYLHRHVAPNEKWRWYVFDVARPALAAILMMGCCRWAHATLAASRPDWFWVIGSAILAFSAASATTPATRGVLVAIWRKSKGRAV